MVVRRTSRRVSLSMSDMISHLNQLFVYPVASEVHSRLCSPIQVPTRIRCFGTTRIAKLSHTESNHSAISVAANRFSRAAKIDAQSALFDYLHSTRGFQFTDAEHISKNSPHFLQNLLSKVENEQDVSRYLSKHFRYNPINEFEPFLESLGLKASEVNPLLPRNLMFLSDDVVLLDNYHLLCDYGIPRTKIGKIYMEANEIFKHDCGILAVKLKAYEELGLGKSTVVKLVTCCPSLLIGGVHSEFVGVLEKLKRLGFGNDWIGRYLSNQSGYNWNRMLETINFLAEVGYTEMEMAVLFKANPALLFESSGKKIYVLIGRLLKLGIKMNEVYLLFLENPEILSPKCLKNLWKAVCFLFEIGMEAKDIGGIVCTCTQLLATHSLKGPKTVLRDFNGHKDDMCQVIKKDPLKLFSLASKSNYNDVEQVASQPPGKFLEKTAFLLKLGYVENSDEMAKALKKFRGRGDELQERFDCLVQAGLDCNVVSDMVKQAPSVLNQSKEVLAKKIFCLRNCLGYSVESIIPFPSYLCYDMDRISLRFSMYEWLRKRDAAKPMLSLSTLLACSDARFVKYFVDVHPEGPAMWDSLKRSLHSR